MSGLFAATAVEAQIITLVSNLARTPTDRALVADEFAHGQGFTTGSVSGGYTLSSIEARLGVSRRTVPHTTIRAELWSAATGGGPGSKVKDLTVPSGRTVGVVSFAAPANTKLSASTTYYFVLYTTGNQGMQIGYMSSGAEDTAQAGWSIGDQRWYVGSNLPSGGAWGRTSGSVKIRVKGTPQQQDTTAPAVSAFDPANGTTTSNAGTNITLTFTEAIRKDSSNTDFTGHADLSAVLRLRRDSSGGAHIPYTASINSAKTVITINPSSNLPEGSVYVAVTNGYYDMHGNQGRAASATFTVDTTDTDPPGGPPIDGAPDLAPSFGDATVSDQSYTAGTPITSLVLPQATGGDGILRYSLTPALPPGLTLDAATRTLSGTPGQAQGAVRYTWRATDVDGDTDELSFVITVAEEPRRMREQDAAKRALSAMARRTMSGALDTIAARFGIIGASGLTLAGQRVSLEGFTATGGVGAYGPCAADSFGPLGGSSGCTPGAQSQSMEAGELLRASAFSLDLGATEGASDPVTPLWSVWGQGDLGTFAGRGSLNLRYDGELHTGWLGMDARSDAWVAGLAVSHGEGEADYGFAEDELSGRGRLEITLTAFYPYWRWMLSDGLELRAVVGAGAGEARHAPEDREREKGDLSMRMVSAGVRRALPDLAGAALAVRADASIVRLETEDGPDVVHGLGVDSWRLRAGMEASRRFVLDDEAAFEPFLEAAVQQDGGDGLEGSGMELAGGLRYVAPGVAVEARGRWLAAHSESGAQEKGVSLTARAGPGSSGRGLWLALNSSLGVATGAGAQALGTGEMTAPSTSGKSHGTVDAQLGYGFGLTQADGVLTPFLVAGLAGSDSRRLRLGTRFDASGADFGVELAAERSEHAAEPEHALRLDLQLQF